MIRLLIADSSRLRREGLRLLFEGEPNMIVVADVATPSDAVSASVTYRPDVVVMGIDQAGRECFEATKRIQTTLPDTRVVAVSSNGHEEQVANALESSTWGYALEGEGFKELRETIQAVYSGRSRYAKAALEKVGARNGELRLGQAPKTKFRSLTPRERELLTLLAAGHSLKKACQALQVSYKTADKHKVNLMKKLDIHDRVELARFAIRERIIEA